MLKKLLIGVAVWYVLKSYRESPTTTATAPRPERPRADPVPSTGFNDDRATRGSAVIVRPSSSYSPTPNFNSGR